MKIFVTLGDIVGLFFLALFLLVVVSACIWDYFVNYRKTGQSKLPKYFK